jgi:ABC transporter substrate binding protein
MSSRRGFITLLGGAAAWPLAVSAQQSKMARIGTLYIGLADAESFKKELVEGLRQLGHVEGKNIAFEFRSAEGKLDRLPELAAELVQLKVDVIVPLYVPSALAAKQATREIPIVIIAADPVEIGIVPSLARPGANITGVLLMSAVFVGKCVELFRLHRRWHNRAGPRVAMFALTSAGVRLTPSAFADTRRNWLPSPQTSSWLLAVQPRAGCCRRRALCRSCSCWSPTRWSLASSKPLRGRAATPPVLCCMNTTSAVNGWSCLRRSRPA